MSDDTTMPAGVLAKLSKVSREIGFIEFDGHNPMYSKGKGKGSNYATAAGVIRKLNVALADAGLVASVPREETSYYPETGVAVVTCCLRVTDIATGEYIDSFGSGSGKDSGDKMVMKASTAAYKYAISHLLVLGWGAEDPEDPKHDASSPKSSAKKTPKRKPRVNPAEVIEKAIAAAETVADLTRIKPDIKKLDKGSEDYEKMVAAYKAREAELS